MRQKPRRRGSARERRIELYVQATIITTISNHRYSHNGGYRGETEHESSPTTPTAAIRLTAEAAAAAAAPTRLWPPPPPPTTTPEATTGLAVMWRLGDYEPGQPLFRRYREISSAPSSQYIQSVSTNHNFCRERRAEAVSNRGPSAYQPTALPLSQTGSQWYTSRVQDTTTASATHSEQTNNTATHVQLTGDQGPARASSLNSQH